MDPLDPRHGTPAGRTAHMRDGEHPCPDCVWAHSVANKRRVLNGSTKVPSLGSQRRIRALQAIGYGKRRIAREIGYSHEGSISYLMRSDTMLAVTAQRITDVYDRLCMTVPQGHVADRTRGWAKRAGFPGPLAWDNIDDPNETPAAAYQPAGHGRDERGRLLSIDDPYDEAAVIRILNGDWRLPCTHADKAEVVARWTLRDPLAKARGLCRDDWDKPSYAYLERLTGWKVERYIKRDEDAA